MNGKIIAGAALAVTGLGLYALTTKTNFTAPDLGAIATRTGQAASTGIQGTLLFGVATVLTACSAVIAINFVATKVYPLNEKGQLNAAASQALPEPEKLKNAAILTLVGAVTAVVVGGPLMKAASSFAQFGSLYFVTTATTLALAGAGGGFYYSTKFD